MFFNPFEGAQILKDYREQEALEGKNSLVNWELQFFFISSSQEPFESVGVNVPILQTKKLRLKEVK